MLIANFLLQVRKKDGEQYKPTSLRSFVSSFDRYLRKKDHSSTVMEGKEFRKTKDVLVAKQKELKKRRERKQTKRCAYVNRRGS